MATSRVAPGRAGSGISRTSFTSARPMDRRVAVPAKITSAISEPRSMEGRCSPSTQARLSEMLDLPQPLGPTTAVIPPGKLSFWASAKDLNP
jgi:hypothetical protein